MNREISYKVAFWIMVIFVAVVAVWSSRKCGQIAFENRTLKQELSEVRADRDDAQAMANYYAAMEDVARSKPGAENNARKALEKLQSMHIQSDYRFRVTSGTHTHTSAPDRR